MSKWKKSFLALLGVLLVSGILSAQAPTGKIIGRISDDEGSPLPGVTVEAISPAMVGKATVLSDSTGTYRLLALPPGRYTLTYTLTGFRTAARTDIILELEKTLMIDVTLMLGKLEETITVVGQSPLIDIKSTTRGATMNRQIFSILPKGRNFDALLVTVPGVSNEPLLAGTSVDGASGAENMYYVDGINSSNLINGVSAQNVNFDFVEEVSFKSSGYQAEFGGSLGGVVNVLTRSGGNAYHGEILAYYVDELLTARRRDILGYDYMNSAGFSYYSYQDYTGKDTMNNVEAGFNLGGYIMKDKLWFFVSGIPQYQYLSRTMNWALQKDPTFERTVTQKDTWWNGQAKLSARPLKNLRLAVSAVSNMRIQRGSLANAFTASKTADYAAVGFNYPNFSVSGMADLVLSNNFLVGFRGGWFMTNQNHQTAPSLTTPIYIFQMEQPYSYDATTNDIAKWPEIPASLRHGPSWASNPLTYLTKMNKLKRERYMAAADMTSYFNAGGEHALKFGAQYIRQGEDVDNVANVPLVYIAWDQTLLAYGDDYGRGKYGWYAVRGNSVTGPYGSFYSPYSNQWALYIQDSWTIGRKLTVNFGVRTESEYIPNYTTDPQYADIKKPVNFDFKDKISPRLGFIYDIFGDSSLKVYGSFAIYEDVMKLDMAANALGGFKWKSTYYTLDDYDFTKIGVGGNYPGTNLATFDFRAPSYETIDPNLKPFSQREIAFGVEKKLTENMSLSVRVVNKSVLHAIEDCGVYVPGIGEVYYQTNPGGPFISQKYADARAAGLMAMGVPDMPLAKRLYWAANVALEKRLADNWLFGFNYTWSRLTGNYSGLANSDEFGRISPNGERSFDLWHFNYDKSLNPIDGPLPTDRTHFIKLYASYVFPKGVTVGAVMNAMSGTPLSEAWNIDGPGYYPFNRGNLGRTPFLFTADLYGQYDIKFGKYGLQFSVNIQNALNADTWTRINNQNNRGNYSPGDDVLLSKNWTLPSTISRNPRYQHPDGFYGPLQARLGVKFIF